MYAKNEPNESNRLDSWDHHQGSLPPGQRSRSVGTRAITTPSDGCDAASNWWWQWLMEGRIRTDATNPEMKLRRSRKGHKSVSLLTFSKCDLNCFDPASWKGVRKVWVLDTGLYPSPQVGRPVLAITGDWFSHHGWVMAWNIHPVAPNLEFRSWSGSHPQRLNHHQWFCSFGIHPLLSSTNLLIPPRHLDPLLPAINRIHKLVYTFSHFQSFCSPSLSLFSSQLSTLRYKSISPGISYLSIPPRYHPTLPFDVIISHC